MRSRGSGMMIFGALAIVLNFFDRVPKLLVWIYNWGEGAAWAIKIGLVVLGAVLFFMGKPDKAEETEAILPKEDKAE